MIETYYAGCYWLGRQESAEMCARRAETLFRLLARCDFSLTRWFEQAGSREAALKLGVEPEASTLLRLFAKERQEDEDWCSLGLWNGGPGEDASNVLITCGSSSHFVPSACVLTPAAEGRAAERMLCAPVLTQILRAMVLAWEPEVGIATSELHRDEVLKKAKVGTFPGWVMYFSHRRGSVPSLPAPVHVELVEDRGTLITLTPEPFTATDSSHVELAAHVGEMLERAGLLKPLQPWDAPDQVR